MMGEEEEKEGSGYLKMTKFGQRFLQNCSNRCCDVPKKIMKKCIAKWFYK